MTRLGLLAPLAFAACAPAISFTSPVTHPTPTAGGTSLGVAAGGLYGSSDEAAILVIPHGEGFVRAPVGAGQVDFHVTSGMASLGFRFDILPMSGGVGIGLEPSLHTSLVLDFDKNTGENRNETDTSGVLFIGGGMKALILVPSGKNFIYFAPVAAISHASSLGEDGPDQSVNLLGLGGAVGVDFGGAPIAMSFEIAFQRSSSMDDDNSDPVWLFAPTLGFRL